MDSGGTGARVGDVMVDKNKVRAWARPMIDVKKQPANIKDAGGLLCVGQAWVARPPTYAMASMVAFSVALGRMARPVCSAFGR